MDDRATTTDGPGRVLDLRGLKCPLPALHTRRALGRLGPGLGLTVLCTDPLAGVDIPHLVAETGDHLVEAAREGAAWRFVIRRGLGGRGGSNGEQPALTVERNDQAD